jgi:hypothetical protein
MPSLELVVVVAVLLLLLLLTAFPPAPASGRPSGSMLNLSGTMVEAGSKLQKTSQS